MRTVKEVAELTGISVRTLHYYDEIGLFKQTQVTEAGYRLYDDNALEKLGQILIFRELELPLVDIKLIMKNPSLDRGILEKQMEMLLIKQEHISNIITNLQWILKGEQKMDPRWFNEGSLRDMYKAMVEGMSDAQKQSFIDYYGSIEEWEKHMSEDSYGEQIQNWYCGMMPMTEAWTSDPKSKKYVALQKKAGEMQRKLANLIGTDVNSTEVRNLMVESSSLVKELYCVNDPKVIMLDMAKRYHENGDMHEAVDFMYGEGTASFISKAILEFYTEK